MNTLLNGSLHGEEATSPSAGFAADIIPETETTQKGVSVNYVRTAGCQWHVLRASYGRETRVRDTLIEMGVYAHVAQRYEVREYDGKRRKVLVSLLPNLVFAYISRSEAELYVRGSSPAIFDNYMRRHKGGGMTDGQLSRVIELSTLVSFYYNHFERDLHDAEKNPPLVIDEQEMISFIRATSTKSPHLKNVDLAKCRFLDNQIVEVIKGDYMGVRGRIARVAGQQCIVVALANGKWNISTEYIPTPYLRVIS